MKIGFIGLGIMGQPMARNLMKAGYKLNVNTNKESVIREFEKEGAKGFKSKKELAENSDIIILMLPNSPDCEEVIFADQGLVDGLSEGKIILDMSSINPVKSKEFAKRLKDIGVKYIDAPVSGGEPKAIDGSLAVMLGCDEEDFEKVEPILKNMASSIVRVGEVGSGNTAKLANQVVVALNIAAVSEAFSLAKKTDTDPNKVYKAIRGGLAGSEVLDSKGPMMLKGDYDPGFRIDLHIKDLQNALDTADETLASIPLTKKVMKILMDLKSSGDGDLDHSAIAKFYEKLNNIDFTN